MPEEEKREVGIVEGSCVPEGTRGAGVAQANAAGRRAAFSMQEKKPVREEGTRKVLRMKRTDSTPLKVHEQAANAARQKAENATVCVL